MSLINEVLKDVEGRRAASEDGAAVSPGLRGQPSIARARRGRWLPFLLVAVASAAAAGFWLARTANGPEPGVAVSATATPSAGVPAAMPAKPALRPAPAKPPIPAGEPAFAGGSQAVAGPAASRVEEATAAAPQPPGTSDDPPVSTASVAASAGREPIGGGADSPIPAAPATPEAPDRPPAVTDAMPRDESVPARRSVRPAGEPVAVPVIQKRQRPATPEQQAARLYSEAYELLARGKRDLAEERLGAALRLQPSHTAAREALAGLMVAEGRWVELVPVLEDGLAIEPGNSKLARLAARVHLEQKNTAAAVAVLESAAAVLPTDTALAATLAATYQRAGRYGESASLYRRLVAAEPANATWWAGLGVALEHTDQFAEAVDAYRKALERPGLAPALADHIRRRLPLAEQAAAESG